MKLWPAAKPPFPCEDPVADPGPETICAHYGEEPERQFGAAAPPVYQTSTFIYPDLETFEKRRTFESTRYDYSRGGNPTVQILEAKLARLERGNWADCFGSGMAAISAAVNACVAADTHVVAVAHCYGPTQWYLQHLQRFGVTTTFVSGTDTAEFERALQANTKLLYLESPTSGRFEVLDVPALVALAQSRGITTIFDNSWASPIYQNPLEVGIDMVVHSATKYLNGHSDVVAGVVAGRDAQIRHRLWHEVELLGGILDPHAAWLMLRGMRTLPLRMERHQSNALAVARALEASEKVKFVLHPGLESHPQRARARAQLRGTGSLFSFALVEQNREAMKRFFERSKLFRIGVSWGGFESLCLGGTLLSESPDKPEWLIRLHVGLESEADLVADVLQALED